MSPKKVDKEKKKQAILMSAIRVFAEKGVHNTKIADLALAAGIGKGTIYEYFRSRDEIFIEAFNFILRDMETRLKAEIAIPEEPETKLKSMTNIVFSSLDQFSGDMANLFIDIWHEGIRSKSGPGGGLIDLGQLYEDIRLEYKQVIDEGIQSGEFRKIDSRMAASTILAAVDGLILQWILNPEAVDLHSANVKIMDLFLNGIKRHEE
ncbi:MAG: TetR/AcrR family transcriptional regulator [candidate division Zixibacteria bacterium]|nr:TetR/AcrR family transcriptional regulator [candidate division Zixibacteria bacterium]